MNSATHINPLNIDEIRIVSMLKRSKKSTKKIVGVNTVSPAWSGRSDVL